MEPMDWEKKRRENAKNKIKVPDGDKASAARRWGVIKSTGNVSSGQEGESDEQEEGD